MKRVPFSAVPVGTEFMWGSHIEKYRNWGKKRTSRTADYRTVLIGKLSDHINWGYWGQDELVYLAS